MAKNMDGYAFVSTEAYKTARALLISYHDHTGGGDHGITEESYQELLATLTRFIERRGKDEEDA